MNMKDYFISFAFTSEQTAPLVCAVISSVILCMVFICFPVNEGKVVSVRYSYYEDAWESENTAPPLLTSALDGGERPASRP